MGSDAIDSTSEDPPSSRPSAADEGCRAAAAAASSDNASCAVEDRGEKTVKRRVRELGTVNKVWNEEEALLA